MQNSPRPSTETHRKRRKGLSFNWHLCRAMPCPRPTSVASCSEEGTECGNRPAILAGPPPRFSLLLCRPPSSPLMTPPPPPPETLVVAGSPLSATVFRVGEMPASQSTDGRKGVCWLPVLACCRVAAFWAEMIATASGCENGLPCQNAPFALATPRRPWPGKKAILSVAALLRLLASSRLKRRLSHILCILLRTPQGCFAHSNPHSRSVKTLSQTHDLPVAHVAVSYFRTMHARGKPPNSRMLPVYPKRSSERQRRPRPAKGPTGQNSSAHLHARLGRE